MLISASLLGILGVGKEALYLYPSSVCVLIPCSPISSTFSLLAIKHLQIMCINQMYKGNIIKTQDKP